MENLADLQMTFLSESASLESRRSALFAISKSDEPVMRSLFEHALEDSDQIIATIALDALCHGWGDAEKYTEKIIDGMNGKPYGRPGPFCDMATSCAGVVLKKILHLEILRLLIDRLENKQGIYSEPERAMAYDALASASGVSSRDLLRNVIDRTSVIDLIDRPEIKEWKRVLLERSSD